MPTTHKAIIGAISAGLVVVAMSVSWLSGTGGLARAASTAGFSSQTVIVAADPPWTGPALQPPA